MAVPQVVSVANSQQMEQMIVSYISQGYQQAVRTDTATVMIKKKELNIVWLIVGFFLCLIPLIIELIRYWRAEDLVVEIRLTSSGSPPPSSSGVSQAEIQGSEPHLSADGTQWWDGTTWHRVTG